MKNRTSATIPRNAVQGVASGVLFMAFFGTLWAGVGIMGLQGWGGPWPPLIALLVGIVLLVGGISLLRLSRQLPKQIAETDVQQGKRIDMLFGAVFAAEGILIAVASVVCNVMNRFDLFFPITACIVGFHFFPLAALFRLKPYYLVGTLLCLLAIVTLLAVPQRTDLGGQYITTQLVVLGFGAALILWSVGLGLWRMGNRLLGLAGLTE